MKWFKAFRRGSINAESEGGRSPQEIDPNFSAQDLDNSWGQSEDGMSLELRYLPTVASIFPP